MNIKPSEPRHAELAERIEMIGEIITKTLTDHAEESGKKFHAVELAIAHLFLSMRSMQYILATSLEEEEFDTFLDDADNLATVIFDKLDDVEEPDIKIIMGLITTAVSFQSSLIEQLNHPTEVH